MENSVELIFHPGMENSNELIFHPGMENTDELIFHPGMENTDEVTYLMVLHRWRLSRPLSHLVMQADLAEVALALSVSPKDR